MRARLAARYRHVLVDELQDASFAQGLLLRLLVAEHGGISAFADDDQAIHRFRGAATKNIRDFRAEWPLATVVRLDESLRSARRRARRGAARWWRRSRTGWRRRWRPADGAPAARSRSGAARPSARRRRRWRPRSSG